MRRIRLLFLCLFPLFAVAQSLTVVELNCENLFDYLDDAGKDDSEYLPEATRHWTKKRYWHKLNNIAQELLSCSDEGIPDLITLCEVENASSCSSMKSLMILTVFERALPSMMRSWIVMEKLSVPLRTWMCGGLWSKA